MELPRGITGFRNVSDPILQLNDVSAFNTNCFTAARAVNGKVVTLAARVASTATNFTFALMELSLGQIAVLINAHFPVIAFANPLFENCSRIRFTDVPELAMAFQDFGTYEVLSVAELSATLTPTLAKQLSSAELKQFKEKMIACEYTSEADDTIVLPIAVGGVDINQPVHDMDLEGCLHCLRNEFHELAECIAGRCTIWSKRKRSQK